MPPTIAQHARAACSLSDSCMRIITIIFLDNTLMGKGVTGQGQLSHIDTQYK